MASGTLLGLPGCMSELIPFSSSSDKTVQKGVGKQYICKNLSGYTVLLFCVWLKHELLDHFASSQNSYGSRHNVFHPSPALITVQQT